MPTPIETRRGTRPLRPLQVEGKLWNAILSWISGFETDLYSSRANAQSIGSGGANCHRRRRVRCRHPEHRVSADRMRAAQDQPFLPEIRRHQRSFEKGRD